MIDVFSKYAWLKILKDEMGETFVNAFIEIVNSYNLKHNELWASQAKEYYNKLKQEWLDNNDVLMYSPYRFE